MNATAATHAFLSGLFVGVSAATHVVAAFLSHHTEGRRLAFRMPGLQPAAVTFGAGTGLLADFLFGQLLSNP